MSLNNTPASERIHIGIFGKRNAGKSSIINAITGQNLAIVSDVKGTTTDPVLKAMELLPLGPVVMIDTPGLDDEGELGKLRIQKAYQMLNKTDLAILVVDSSLGMTKEDMKEIASIINLVLQGTKPGLTKEGKPAKGKIEIDAAVEEEGKKRVNALLSKYVLYPELDLDFLKAEFVKD
jgi:small GTP-binding protein